jgi:hypothetical protein
MIKLKYTTINPLLDLHYVNRMGIKLNISEAAKIAESKAKTNAEKGRYANLCGWTESLRYPNRYREFHLSWAEMIFNGFHGNKTNLAFLLESKGIKYWEQPQVHWIWYSPVVKKTGLKILKSIYEQASPNTKFFIASGDETSNRNVETEVNDFILKNKGKQIVILSIGMGSRSCSVPKLYYSHYCYDGGSKGPMTQQGMRVTTTDLDNLEKIGTIISHSFNPNTDDKLDFDILDANKIQKKGGIQQTIEFAREVFPIYSAGDVGLEYEDYTEFIKGLIDRGSVSKVAVSRIDISNIPKDYIQRVSNGITNSILNIETIQTTTSTKTIRNRKSVTKSKKDNIEDKFREVCKYVYDHSHYIIGAGRSYGVNSILESFDCIESDKQFNILKKDIENAYGIKYEDLKKLFVDKIIDTDWCDMNSIVKIK